MPADLPTLDIPLSVLESATTDQLLALAAKLKAVTEGWHLQPRQLEADRLADRCDELLFGGSAGGAKSNWLLHRAYRKSREIPGHRTLMLRRTFPELQSTLIEESFNFFDQRVCTYKSSEHAWVFSNSSKIEFGHMEREDDRTRYQGVQVDMVCFDELTHFTEKQYTYLFSRCRVADQAKKRAGARPHFCAATNPGGVGHAWVKERFIDRGRWGVPHEVRTARGRHRTVAFVQSRLSDNRYLAEDGAYEAALLALPEVERRQLLDGDWDAFDGRFFTWWDRDVHVVPPFEIPAWWPRGRGIDYGYAAPFACVWGAWAPDGDFYVYREAYEREFTPRMQAELVLSLSGNERYRLTAADPSIWARTGVGETIAHQYSQAGLHAVRAMNQRKPGWAVLHDLMRVTVDGDGNKRSRLKIFDTCTALIRTLPSLPRDSTDPDDVDTKSEDHLADAWRYLVVTGQQRSRAPAEGQSEISRLLEPHDRHRRTQRHRHNILGRY